MFSLMMAPNLPTQRQEKTEPLRVAVERPVDFGFDHAECFLPAVKWFNVEGFTADDLNFLTEFVRSNAPFIFELAERQKAGPAVSALAP